MLDRIRERVEDLLEAAARERQKMALSELGIPRLGERYAHPAELFRSERVNEVQMALAGASGTEEKRARFLLDFLVHGRAMSAAAAELDQLLTWRAHHSLRVEDEQIPLRSVRSVLRRATDRPARRAVEEALLGALDQQASLLEGLLTTQRDVVMELGYGSYLESCEVLSGVDLRGLARDGARFLEETDAVYRELLAWHLPRLADVAPGEATAADGLRLEAAHPFDAWFPGGERLQAVGEALAACGLDARAQGRIQVVSRGTLPDGRGGVCHPLRVPDEVLLLESREPGRAVERSRLLALGEALHAAYTDADLPVELRRLGDGALPLGVGLAVAGLLDNPAWLSRMVELPRGRAAEYRRLAALLRLMAVRRAVGQLQFELPLLEAPDARDAGERYAETMIAATGLRHDPRAALWSVRPGFQVAQRVRAYQLGAVLSDFLRDRFDEDWFRNPSAGPALADLFATGRSFTAGELAVQLTSEPLSFQRVRTGLDELLG